MSDMMPYKIRLVRAMPEKIHREKDSMWDIDRGWFDCDDESEEWKFWGPLADKMKVRACLAAMPISYAHEVEWWKPTVLESIADAVCQEAEHRKDGTP